MATPSKASDPTALLPKELKVVESYLASPRLGKTKAFMSEFPQKNPDRTKAHNMATRKASAFFKRRDVKAYIDKRRAEIQVSSGVTFEYLVAQQRRVLERCMQVAKVKDAKGKDVGEFQFNATGANKAVETLGKLIGAFEADNKQKGEATGDAFAEMMDRIANGSHKPGQF